MTLKEIYENLPKATYPKKEFIQKLADECNVSTGAVRSWIFEGKTPSPARQETILAVTQNQVHFNLQKHA